MNSWEGFATGSSSGGTLPAISAPIQIILKERDKPYHWEYYNPMVDRYFMIVDRIIKWPDGRDVRFEIAKDITERKKAEEALRLSNLYNRSLIEASLDPLVTIGPDGKIMDVNGATEHVTGYSRSELIGTDFSDYFTEPGKPVKAINRCSHMVKLGIILWRFSIRTAI